METRILFEQVEDSRQDWKVKHSISEILTVVMCGVSAVVAGGLLYKSLSAFFITVHIFRKSRRLYTSWQKGF